ncbi:MAG: BON domain-containing protein [Sterolibacterium sp.]
MKLLKSCKLVGVALLLIVGLNACGKPGPAETAGKKIDQAADSAGKKIDQVVDEAGKRVGEAAAKVQIKMGEQGDKAGVAVDDAEITAKIKAAIFAEPGLKSLQISVDTAKGVVTLSGSVNSQQSSDMARGLASAVAGVRGVENHLALKPTN